MHLQEELKKIADQYGIAAIYVFGSRSKEISAKCSNTPFDTEFSESDVDLGVLLRPNYALSIQRKVRLAAEMEDLMDVNRADLVFLQDADPFLAADIVRGELIYCSDPEMEGELQLNALRRAGDLAYYKRHRINRVLMREST